MKYSQIIDFFKGKISEIAEIPSDQIDEKNDLSQFGVDSVMVVVLTEDINTALGKKIIESHDLYGMSSLSDMAQCILMKQKMVLEGARQ